MELDNALRGQRKSAMNCNSLIFMGMRLPWRTSRVSIIFTTAIAVVLVSTIVPPSSGAVEIGDYKKGKPVSPAQHSPVCL